MNFKLIIESLNKTREVFKGEREQQSTYSKGKQGARNQTKVIAHVLIWYVNSPNPSHTKAIGNQPIGLRVWLSVHLTGFSKSTYSRSDPSYRFLAPKQQWLCNS